MARPSPSGQCCFLCLSSGVVHGQSVRAAVKSKKALLDVCSESSSGRGSKGLALKLEIIRYTFFNTAFPEHMRTHAAPVAPLMSLQQHWVRHLLALPPNPRISPCSLLHRPSPRAAMLLQRAQAAGCLARKPGCRVSAVSVPLKYARHACRHELLLRLRTKAGQVSTGPIGFSPIINNPGRAQLTRRRLCCTPSCNRPGLHCADWSG